MTWAAEVRAWGRQYGATHAIVEGAGPRRRLLVTSIPASIVRVWGQVEARAYGGTTLAVETVDGRKAIVHSPTRRVADGYDPDGRRTYVHLPVTS